jgi:iron complex transport system substrate-binding protein
VHRGDGHSGSASLVSAALQLRDSAGLAPDFPQPPRYSFCLPSIRVPPTLASVSIVSLLPSATETVCLLGLEDQLVGVSADSDWPPDVVGRLPILNTVSIDTRGLTSSEIDQAAATGHRGASLYHVDAELLRRLQPDLILTQEICEVCAVSRQDVEVATSTLGHRPAVLSLSPATLEQVVSDVARIADETGAAERGAVVVRGLNARLAAVRERAAGLAPVRVFCMEWLDPPYTAGHWIPEMVQLAGGYDQLGTPGGPSRRVPWQMIAEYAPEALVLMPCSLTLERVAYEFDMARRLPSWEALPAVQARTVFAGDTHLFSRSGPRLVDGVEVLARMLHPEVFDQPLAAGRALKLSDDGRRLEPFQ